MQFCQFYEQKLLAGIPYRYRYGVENCLRSFQQSHVMLQVYARAFETTALPDLGNGKTLVPVAFGSFGRLDGSPSLSDYDTLFLYPGKHNVKKVTAIQKAIADVIRSNKGLPFDHRNEIEIGTFDFSKSPAYPVLAFTELLLPVNETRALNLLTEGRVLHDKTGLNSLRLELIVKWGYKDNVHLLNLSEIRDALGRLKSAYCVGVLGRLKADKRPLTNRKILKLFTLREFFYLTTLFSVAEVAIGISAHACTKEDAIQLLGAPSVLKIASYADATGGLGILLKTLAPDVVQEMCKVVETYAKPMGKKPGGGGDPLEDAFFGNLRAIIMAILEQYDALLSLLHDLQFLEAIEPFEPDVGTWLTVRQFRDILRLRAELVKGTVVLANALREVLALVPTAKTNAALNDAQTTLKQISEYKLELDLSQPKT